MKSSNPAHEQSWWGQRLSHFKKSWDTFLEAGKPPQPKTYDPHFTNEEATIYNDLILGKFLDQTGGHYLFNADCQSMLRKMQKECPEEAQIAFEWLYQKLIKNRNLIEETREKNEFFRGILEEPKLDNSPEDFLDLR